MLRQASDENRPTTSSIIYSPTKKKKSVTQPIKKVSTLPPTSLCALALSTSSFMASTEHDSTVDTPSIGIEPETEVEPVMPRIICEVEKEEDMAANLRVGFKERQCKRLSKSIAITHFPTKKSFAEVPCSTPVSDILPAPKPLANAAGPSCVSTMRLPVGKDAHSERGGASTSLAPPNDDPIERVASVPTSAQTPHAPN